MEVGALKQKTIEKDPMVSMEFAYEGPINEGHIKYFYKKEQQFIERLFDQEKEKAYAASSDLLDVVEELVSLGRYPSLKYYMIALTSIITQKIQRIHSKTTQGFLYSTTIYALIEEKFEEETAHLFVTEMIEFFYYVVGEKAHPKLLHQTVNEVIQYIDDHIQEPISVEGLAKTFDVSTSHLSRIFREHANVTLVEYINIKKVEEAQYYLKFSKEKISDISDQFNFCNQSYFTRIFKKHTGFTPRKFKSSLEGPYFSYELQPES